MEHDIRWEQRFSNFLKALQKLSEAIQYIEQNGTNDGGEHIPVLNEIVKEGLIQRFEYTHELAWNVMKDYAAYQGNPDIGGSRDAVREAFQLNLITNGKVWMDMIASRNKTFQTYIEETADEIYSKIIETYYPAFLAFQSRMESKRSGEQGDFF